MTVVVILLGSVALGIALGCGGVYWQLVHVGDNIKGF